MAQSRAAELQTAREALSSYDVAGSSTTAVLSGLTTYMGRVHDATSTQEARFLRAAVAADLLVLAHLSGAAALRPRVADALQVGATELDTYLNQELTAVAVRHYRDTAREGAESLKLLTAVGAATAVDWTRFTGTRRDAILLRTAADALRAPNADPVTTLARFGADPCAAGTCAPLYASFGAEGRRAVAGLEQIAGAMRSLAHASANGDPFSSAVHWTEDRATIERVVLEPPAKLGGLGFAAAPEARAVIGRVALALGVTASGVVYCHVPRVVIRGGHAVLDAAGEPVFPATAEIDLQTEDGRIALRELLSASAVDAARSRVAIGVLPNAVGSMLGRVLRDVQGAGIEHIWFAGRGADNEMRGVEITVPASAQPVRGMQLRVRVLEWGYSMMTAAGAEAIPRVRIADGGGYDIVRLTGQVQRATFESASLQFHPNAMGADVFVAAMQVAPGAHPLVLMTP